MNKVTMSYVLIPILLAFSGFLSGLNIGLFALRIADLERKAKVGNHQAQVLLPIRKKGNQLLVSLLLGNVAANSALSIFLADVTTGVIGGIIATILILVFTEILPQSWMTRFALSVGAKTAPVIWLVIYVFYPLAYPIGRVLDWWVGDELQSAITKEELKEFIIEQRSSQNPSIDADEERIVLGALTFSNKVVGDIITSKKEVFLLNVDEVVDEDLVARIRAAHFTRIPVYQDNDKHVIGLLYAKNLIGADLSEKKKVGDYLDKKEILLVDPNQPLDTVMNLFISKHQHLACVLNEDKEFVGVITLEDVIEDILSTEVYDEGDTPVKAKTAST